MFYGWWMVAISFAAQFIASGLAFYALPRLLVPLADEFADGERATIALLIPAMSLPGIVFAPLVGKLIARFPVGRVMSAGALILAIGFLLASRAQSFWQIALVYSLAVSVGVASLGNLGANTLVANWFDRRRPMALGISQVGISLSGAIMTFFIAWTLAAGGWRGTYLWFAGIAAIAAPLLWLLVSTRPSDRGLHPDGATAQAPEPAGFVYHTLRFADAVRHSSLWRIGLAVGLCFAGATAVLQNIHALSMDAGHSSTRADQVLATMAIGAAAGKLLFGWLGVRLGEKPAFLVAIIGEGAGLALLPAVGASFPLLLAVSLSFGLVLGGVMPAMAALLARVYGARDFGPVMGYVTPMLIPFQMAGAPLAAWVYDTTGTYDAAIYAFVGACTIAALAIVGLRVRVHDTGAAAEAKLPAQNISGETHS